MEFDYYLGKKKQTNTLRPPYVHMYGISRLKREGFGEGGGVVIRVVLF